jgi:hypothetical protein
MSTNRDLKAYIRIDGSGRDVAGSLVLRTKMPKNGKWRQILAGQCCNPVVGPTTTTTTTRAIVIVLGAVGTGEGSNSEVCFQIQFYSEIYMSLATPNVIAIGDTFYNDAAGTNPLVGNGTTWRVFRTPDASYYAAVWDANGVVTGVASC